MFRPKAESSGEGVGGAGGKTVDTSGGVSLSDVATIVQHFDVLNLRVRKLLDAIDTLKKFHRYVIKPVLYCFQLKLGERKVHPLLESFLL